MRNTSGVYDVVYVTFRGVSGLLYASVHIMDDQAKMTFRYAYKSVSCSAAYEHDTQRLHAINKPL